MNFDVEIKACQTCTNNCWTQFTVLLKRTFLTILRDQVMKLVLVLAAVLLRKKKSILCLVGCRNKLNCKFRCDFR